MLEADVRTFVLADGAVAALVGSRMYARMLPQTPTLPALVFQRIDTRRQHDLGDADGLPRVRLQVTAWASLPLAAATVAQAVRSRLDGVKGVMGASTIGACLCVGERDVSDPDPGRFGVALDFLIQVEEA